MPSLFKETFDIITKVHFPLENVLYFTVHEQGKVRSVVEVRIKEGGNQIYEMKTKDINKIISILRDKFVPIRNNFNKLNYINLCELREFEFYNSKKKPSHWGCIEVVFSDNTTKNFRIIPELFQKEYIKEWTKEQKLLLQIVKNIA